MTTILCIEDEADLREDIVEELEEAGYDVKQACDGRAGLEMILNCKPDLVISDITMPNMSGHELLQEVREKYEHMADMPIIFLSALADGTHVREGLNLGADDFLTKPIDLEMLVTKVNSHIRQIERMRASKERQFVKLYSVLSDGSAEAPDVAPAKAELRPSSTKPKAVKKSKKAVEAVAPETSESEGQRNVFGSIFRFGNLGSVGDDLGSHREEFRKWAESRVMKFLKSVLPAKSSVTAAPGGGVVACYRDATRAEVANQSERLAKEITENLQGDELDEFATNTSIPRDVLAHAVVLSQSVFETTITSGDADSENRFLVAIEEQVALMSSDASAPEKLCDAIKRDRGHLERHNLVARKKHLRGLCFFEYDDASQQKITSSFTLFSRRNLIRAGYLLDVLTLSLLKNELRTNGQNSSVVVDVHFETLNNDKYYLLYLNQYSAFKKLCPSRVIINVRGVSQEATESDFEKILAPFESGVEARCVQLEASAINDCAGTVLPVASVVLSYRDVMQSRVELSAFPKISQTLSKSNTSLILRDFPSKDEILEFGKYGFEGFAVKDE